MAGKGVVSQLRPTELWSQRPLGLDSALQGVALRRGASDATFLRIIRDLGKKMIRTAVLAELNMVVMSGAQSRQ